MAKKPRSTPPELENVEIRTRLPSETLEMIDAWRAAQPDKPTRPEAIRRLLQHHFWPTI